MTRRPPFELNHDDPAEYLAPPNSTVVADQPLSANQLLREQVIVTLRGAAALCDVRIVREYVNGVIEQTIVGGPR